METNLDNLPDIHK